MKSYMNNWRGFVNEAKKAKKQLEIMKQDGSKELVDVAYESPNWFIWKMGKVRSKSLYSVNHKASGMAIPSTYYAGGLKNAKDLINNVLETLDLPDLSSSTLSDESIKVIHSAVVGSDYTDSAFSYERVNEKLLRDILNTQDALLEFTSKETSASFGKFADAVRGVSDSMAQDAEKSVEFQELYAKFEEVGLTDFLNKIPDVEELLANLETGEGLGELVQSLEKVGIEPSEIGEKLEQIEALRLEFDEYKKEQEKSAEESEKNQKNMERGSTEAEVATEGE